VYWLQHNEYPIITETLLVRKHWKAFILQVLTPTFRNVWLWIELENGMNS